MLINVFNYFKVNGCVIKRTDLN